MMIHLKNNEGSNRERKKMQDVKGVKETVKENDEGIVETITIDLKMLILIL